MENCGYCGLEITQDDSGTWVDNFGSEVCPYRAGLDPHSPAGER